MSRAPYRVGDRVNVLRSDGGTTCSGPLTVERVVELNTNGHWRIETTRHDGTALHVIVDHTGRDRHGYAEPVRKSA